MPGGKWQETDQTDKPDKVWWVTIYGEAPGSVVYRSVLGSIKPE